MDDNIDVENVEKLTPVLPMKDIIIYPSMVAPVLFSKSQSADALLTPENEIVMLVPKKNDIETLDIKDFYETGVLAKVIQTLKFPDGTVKALVECVERINVTELVETDSSYKAQYSKLEEVNADDETTKPLVRHILNLFKQYLNKSSKISPDNFLSISEISQPGKLADIIATYLPVEIKEKQKVLETLNTYDRLEYVGTLLSKEIELLGVELSIEEKVKFKLDKTQKDYLLREKLLAIKEELSGENGLDSVQELRQKIDKMKLAKPIKDTLNKELNKLDSMPSYNSESAVLQTHVETVLSLPWNKKTKDIVDIDSARKVLDEDHYGLKDVKERILEFLAVKKLSNKPSSTIICFVGPPGVGKTSLARSIAKSLNRKFAQISLGGINDESEIRGHRRTYVGSMPGRIIRAIQDAGTKNPVILLDEIEKMVASHMGDPTAAMLEVLDPAQNCHYTDHYIDVPFDLSDVFFIATANSVERLYKPLRDRLEIINLSGYTEDEKFNIATKFLIPRQLKINGILKTQLKINDTAVHKIICDYTRESGVRSLERNIAKICRKTALKIVEDQTAKKSVNSKNIHDYLGVEKFTREKAEKKPQVGLVHGLAWTEVGGELLDLEATIMPGKGKLNLTGRLGEVMQESAKLAFSYVRSNYKALNLSDDIQDKYDIHLHAPDGATPKDGPSAGIALTIAMISAFTHRAVKEDVAMTGEITLRGRVLPIGGLKEKSIAALRNNIKTVIIPKANEKDLEEFPDYLKENIEFKPVDNIEQVINYILI